MITEWLRAMTYIAGKKGAIYHQDGLRIVAAGLVAGAVSLTGLLVPPQAATLTIALGGHLEPSQTARQALI